MKQESGHKKKKFENVYMLPALLLLLVSWAEMDHKYLHLKHRSETESIQCEK